MQFFVTANVWQTRYVACKLVKRHGTTLRARVLDWDDGSPTIETTFHASEVYAWFPNAAAALRFSGHATPVQPLLDSQEEARAVQARREYVDAFQRRMRAAERDIRFDLAGQAHKASDLEAGIRAQREALRSAAENERQKLAKRYGGTLASA